MLCGEISLGEVGSWDQQSRGWMAWKEGRGPTSAFLSICEGRENSRCGRVKHEDVQVQHVSFFNMVWEFRNYPCSQRETNECEYNY